MGDLVDGDGEPWDNEVGVARAGRLTQQAEGTVPATLTASDVGIDGAAASAEEAANAAGLSLNSWIVDAVRAAATAPADRPPPRPGGPVRNRRRIQGWAR